MNELQVALFKHGGWTRGTPPVALRCREGKKTGALGLEFVMHAPAGHPADLARRAPQAPSHAHLCPRYLTTREARHHPQLTPQHKRLGVPVVAPRPSGGPGVTGRAREDYGYPLSVRTCGCSAANTFIHHELFKTHKRLQSGDSARTQLR